VAGTAHSNNIRCPFLSDDGSLPLQETNYRPTDCANPNKKESATDDDCNFALFHRGGETRLSAAIRLMANDALGLFNSLAAMAAAARRAQNAPSFCHLSPEIFRKPSSSSSHIQTTSF
jgi:hypothetical protein